MQSWNGRRRCGALGWALAMLMSMSPAAAQEFAARERLRAHGEQEFRKDICCEACRRGSPFARTAFRIHTSERLGWAHRRA
jgi:hypothetical protein